MDQQADQLSCNSNLEDRGPSALPALLQAVSQPLECSPVTDLARNLGGLLSNSRGTPRRRISWSSNEDTPECVPGLRKPLLFLGGSVDNSPNLNYHQDSPMFKDRLLRDVSVADNCLNTSGSRGIRRVRTLPLTLQDPFGKENVPRRPLEHLGDVASSPSELFLSKYACPQVPPSTSFPGSANHRAGRTMFSPHSDSDSHDSGCGLLQEHAALEKSFMAPAHPPPRRFISPLKGASSQQALTRLNSTGSSFGCSSSERSSTSASCDDADDGFLDAFEMDTLDSDSSLAFDFPLPRDFHHLIKGPLSTNTCDVTAPTQREWTEAESPKRPPIRRCLSMIEESPVARPFPSAREKLLSSIDCNNNLRNALRRPEDTRKRLLQDEEDSTFKKPCEPTVSAGELRTQQDFSFKHNQETKRRKSVSYLTKSCSDSLVLPSPRILLQRSHSETDAITNALNKSSHNPNLIGDCSGTYALPMIKGRHDDLKTISCSTLSNLMQGVYKDEIKEYTIVDCRYPYEFEGGHITGACNLYTKESILEKLVDQQPSPSASKNHKILVFHCEFSSERGPNLCRFLRNKDREANKDNYPNLFHPEVYLLEGGYRDFFDQHKGLCTPQSYLPMLSKDHEKDLRKFRSKSKSWSGDTKSRIAVRPGLKL